MDGGITVNILKNLKRGYKMGKIFLTLVALLLVAGVGYSFPPEADSEDIPITVGGWGVQQVRQYYVTGSGAVSSTLSIPHQGTQVFELVSIEIHLSAAGTAGDFTMTLDSGQGSEYDTLLVSQDMTTVTDYVRQFGSEYIFRNVDSIVLAWANGSAVTYGITIKYKLR